MAVAGRDAGKAQALAAELQRAGHPALGLALDVRDAAQIRDCIARVAIHWCVRRNDVAKGIFEGHPSLVAFMARFEAIPSIAAFLARQAAARAADDSV